MTVEVDVQDLTRARVDAQAVRALVRAVLTAEGVRGAEVGVRFVGERRMRALNARFRGRDEVTDVLSFPLEDGVEGGAGGPPQAGPQAAAAAPPRLLGDVVVCLRRARCQAARHDVPPDFELALLLVHGLLHLLGYDHEVDAGRMALRQGELLASLSWEGIS